MLRFRSKRGKLLLEISNRNMCPLRNTLLVDHKSMVNLYTCPGFIRLAFSCESR